MKKVNIVFGNHNTVNAIEDYIHFLGKTFSSLPFKVVISKEIVDDADILVMQEDFKRKNVKEMLEYKKDRAKKLVVVATENIVGDSFNDNLEVTSILDKKDDLEKLADAQVRAGNWPTYILKRYLLV
jgi:UDP-N-acetyl-D-mannosaminuronate dehydrogenase